MSIFGGDLGFFNAVSKKLHSIDIELNTMVKLYESITINLLQLVLIE